VGGLRVNALDDSRLRDLASGGAKIDAVEIHERLGARTPRRHLVIHSVGRRPIERNDHPGSVIAGPHVDVDEAGRTRGSGNP